MDNPLTELSKLDSVHLGAVGAAFVAFTAAARRWLRRDRAEERVDAAYAALIINLEKLTEGMRKELSTCHEMHQNCLTKSEDLRRRVETLEKMVRRP